MKATMFGNELPKIPHMYLVYGEGGTGKTSLIKSYKGKKLVISFDSSLQVLEEENANDYATIIYEEQDYNDIDNKVLNLLNSLLVPVTEEKAKNKQWQLIKNFQQADMIVLDGITNLHSIVFDYITHKSKDNRQNYQAVQSWFLKLSRTLQNLSQNGKTIYVTGHEVADGEFGNYKMSMNQTAFNQLTSNFSIVGRIYKEKGERFIDLDPENGNHCKNRISNHRKIKAQELFNLETLEVADEVDNNEPKETGLPTNTQKETQNNAS